MTILRGLLPKGMVGRIALVLVLALVLEMAGNLVLFERSERDLVSADRAQHFAEQLLVAERVVRDVEPQQRARLMRDMRTRDVGLNWVQATVIADAAEAQPALARMKARMIAAAPALAARDLRLNIIRSGDSPRRDLIGAFGLADGSFVTFRVSPFLSAPPGILSTMLLHLALIAGVVTIALLMAHTLVRPLRALAAAADRTRSDQPVPMPQDGPYEVRQLSAALGDMQDRLIRAVSERTESLVALSHDLRTPIQRLRLRASLLDDAETRDAMTADLDDMERFVGSVLAYMRGDETEAPRLIDLVAVATTIVDQAADAGADIDYDGPYSLEASVPPIAFKRALVNLVENAVRHGDTVRLALSRDAGMIRVTIEDDGPGIPVERRTDAFAPFRRLESARSAGSGGAGLGLAIVQRATAAMGGRVDLGESAMGGLLARIEIPDEAGRS
jgi:two-component system osmolarity sensor histidine kinase EnvZ